MTSSKKNHKADSFPKDGPVDTSRRNLIKGAGMVGVAALGTSAENIIAQEVIKNVQKFMKSIHYINLTVTMVLLNL